MRDLDRRRRAPAGYPENMRPGVGPLCRSQRPRDRPLPGVSDAGEGGAWLGMGRAGARGCRCKKIGGQRLCGGGRGGRREVHVTAAGGDGETAGEWLVAAVWDGFVSGRAGPVDLVLLRHTTAACLSARDDDDDEEESSEHGHRGDRTIRRKLTKEPTARGPAAATQDRKS